MPFYGHYAVVSVDAVDDGDKNQAGNKGNTIASNKYVQPPRATIGNDGNSGGGENDVAINAIIAK